MTVGASKAHRVAGALMVVAALAYLVPFVPRGWVPHDEGMIGQSAERVLQGGIPHIDYEEPYTGGLSWLYAGVFKVSGVDLLNVRWLLFAGAALASWLMYVIFRRYLAPAAAGLATWVAVGWSFPNYFAGLPSWWLLVCALACMWALIRHVETRQWQDVAVGGLAAGVAIAIKQTGIYLLDRLRVVDSVCCPADEPPFLVAMAPGAHHAVECRGRGDCSRGRRSLAPHFGDRGCLPLSDQRLRAHWSSSRRRRTVRGRHPSTVRSASSASRRSPQRCRCCV